MVCSAVLSSTSCSDRFGIDAVENIFAPSRKHAAGMKIPYSAIVGPRDEEAGEVNVRAFGIKDALGSMPVDDFVDAIADEIACKGSERLTERFETAGV